MTNHASKQEQQKANPRKLTDLHRAMVEMRKTATRRETAQQFGVPVSQVSWAESIWHWHQRGEALLSIDPESLEGLSLTGEISKGLGDCLQYFCGIEKERQRVPNHEDYQRISDVLLAGEAKVRNRWAMGPSRWAEWLAFMWARGLEWGKPLSEPKDAPAKPLQPGWNVVNFPERGELRQAKLTNSYIRARCKSLDRDWWSLWELLQELPGGDDAFGPHFGTVQRALDKVWDKLVEMRVIEGSQE